MIIESHAHYTHRRFDGSFSALRRSPEGYYLAPGTRDELLEELKAAGIVCSIEPGIDLASNYAALRLSEQYPGRVFVSAGVHPTRTWGESWRSRKELPGLTQHPSVVAIGETGLDYHYPRKNQHRLCQKRWFRWQLRLARQKNLPLVLHIRNADRHAIRILKRHRCPTGGVVHCFCGDWKTAAEYLGMGLYLGIGGALLQSEERAAPLWDAVRRTPLERILVETDAPFVLPDCGTDIPSKKRRKAQNTSLILPAVIEKIAELKGISANEVEKATTANAIRLFRLELNDE